VSHWLPILSTDGLYEASDTGDVRSISRVITKLNRWGNMAPLRLTGRVLKPWRDSNGYAVVSVLGRAVNVHRLIAEAFHGANPEMDVNHKDGNKQNNSASNLEWVTHSENANHAVRIGLVKARPVVGTPKAGGDSVTYPSAGAAAIALGGLKKRGNIMSAALGMVPSAYGFKWSFEKAA